MESKTITFNISDKRALLRKDLEVVYKALKEKGYNPERQIEGYILSGDPTYVTNYMNARQIISKIDTYDLLEEIVKSYFE